MRWISSTPELVRRIGSAMGRRARLIPVPVRLLQAIGAGLGRGGEVRRLCASLTVDVAPTCEALHWRPPVSFEQDWVAP